MTDEDVVTLDMPGLLAEHIGEAEFGPVERAAFDNAEVIRRGRGSSRRITAPLAVHKDFLERCWVLEGGARIDSSSSENAAYRRYAQRIAQAEQGTGTQ